MKHIARVVALPILVLGLAACGGGGDSDAEALRGEVAALRQELADATSTTTTSSTTTTAAPAPVTTVTTAPPKQPQGKLEWTGGRAVHNGVPCASYDYTFTNRSDTPVLEATIKGVTIQEAGLDERGVNTFSPYVPVPAQTIPLGVAAFGETTVRVEWCVKNPKPNTRAVAANWQNATFTWRWINQQ